MKIKEIKSIILFPIVAFFAWLYWSVIDFSNSISTKEERMEPEIPHPKGLGDYIFEAPFYILLAIATYLLWRIIKANKK